MSRRDTIIIAVLLNAGLLVVLFATSLKTEKFDDEPSAITVLASNQSEARETPKVAKVVKPVPSVSKDSVDQAIDQYVTPHIASSDQHNALFLSDLQAIGSPLPEPQHAPVEMAAPVGSYREVRVKKGDVLERIARQNQVSVGEIMKANKLSSSRLSVGQVLKIPAATAVKTAPAEALSATEYYTIKAGDNPWTIAVKHHMKVEELLKLNGMDEQKAKRLKVGDKIRVK